MVMKPFLTAGESPAPSRGIKMNETTPVLQSLFQNLAVCAAFYFAFNLLSQGIGGWWVFLIAGVLSAE